MGLFDKFIKWTGGGVRGPGPDVRNATSTGGGSGGGSSKRDPAETIVKRIALANGEVSRDYVEPEFDLTEITAAYNTESYVRQAVDKYIELMFKAGWDLVGKNVNAVEYLKARLAMIAEVTSIPTEQLFIEMAEDLVKYSNVTLAKARMKDPNQLPPNVQVQGVGDNEAIVGYFPVNVTTMLIKRDKFGTVQGWQQEVADQDKPVKFKPQDIIHIYYKREKGNAFGTPFLLPVLDDIRALRQAEENVLKLIYRNLFPYIHVQVGLPDEGLGATDPEIQRTQNDIESMDLEAGLVTSERVNIKPVANNQIIDANPYLQYFEQRVFTGLGVSALMMGRGDTSNRSTGDNLSSEFADRVKAFQKVFAIFVNEFMIKELLMEGGFDSILNPDDKIEFIFKEINIDSKIKAENHAIFQYEHNAITEDEMRALLGRDPIEDGDARSKMHLQVITVGTMEAAASYGSSGADSGAGGDKKKETDNKNKPTNQHGTKTAPKKESRDEHIDEYKQYFKETLQVLNGDVNKLIENYLDGDESALNELAKHISFTELNTFDVMKAWMAMGEDAEISTSINRGFKYLHESIVEEVIGKYEGIESSHRAIETVNAVFSIMEDRFDEILDSVLKL